MEQGLPVVHVALLNPQIPPNTGNVARLTAAMGVPLWIVGEAGFSMTEKALRRAGLDYWPLVDVRKAATVWELIEKTGTKCVVPITTRGRTALSEAKFEAGDCLLFGSESTGLPPEVHRDFGEWSVKIDMWGEVRSLNLSTAAGIVLFEALRQVRCAGARVERPRPGD